MNVSLSAMVASEAVKERKESLGLGDEGQAWKLEYSSPAVYTGEMSIHDLYLECQSFPLSFVILPSRPTFAPD